MAGNRVKEKPARSNKVQSVNTITKRITMLLSTGYILMFFSEFVFYGEISPEAGATAPSLPESLMLWGIYAALGYLMLALIKGFRVRSVWALFLVGAAYGWLLEGVVVSTMYEDLPFQVHFTGIAWHAPLDVLVGWYLIQKLLRERSQFKTMVVASLLGLCWGLWVIWRWWEEGTPITLGNFALFTWSTTLLLIFAYWLLGKCQLAEFRSSKRALWILAGLLLLWFVLTVLPSYSFAILVLLPLLALIYLALRKNKCTEPSADLLSTLERQPRALNCACLLLTPLLATASYALCLALDLRIPINAILYVLSSILGIGMFIISVVKILRRRSPMPPTITC